ncbi:hypothetical protein VE03_02225 [Pseudogymnoascus sp. 23342-1-I1]|nr:hypothetical protein VE03_02225 [Pseudogymnoascus sp. 23342-1-I1]
MSYYSSFARSILLLFLLYYVGAIASPSEDSKPPPTFLKHQLRALQSKPEYKSQNATQNDVIKANKLVADAIAQQGRYNTYRVENPVRNTYISRFSTRAKDEKRSKSRYPPPLFNSTVLAAARLLAERDAAAQHSNGTLHRAYRNPKKEEETLDLGKRAADTYWVEEIAHTGRSPIGGDPNYKVFRNVKDPLFGAVGDGLTDDTAAINRAIDYGNNCGANCMSSSIKGTLIYFPAGTYLISSPINAYYYTQLVGNAVDFPVIKMAASFIGLGAIQTNVYYPGGSGGEWYIQQSNFFRQVRNFNIDITAATVEKASAFHWQVAQATSLDSVNVYASKAAGNTQIGMFTENGSGGFMSACYFEGGNYGIYGGNQQYTVRGFEFEGQRSAAIALLWDWGWTWSRLTISNTPIGILLINPEAPLGGQQAGSTFILDSSFYNVKTAIKAEFPQKTILRSSIISLNNVMLRVVGTVVGFSDGSSLALDPSSDILFVVVGNMEADGPLVGSFDIWDNVPQRPSSLVDNLSDDKFKYVVKQRPQYERLDTSDIISVKSHGAVGNGVHDDSDAIIATLALATTDNLIYFPAGSYLVTKTILFPKNARITGEVWSQIVASGSYFADMDNPKVMVKVGNRGDVGSIEITDMIFTSIGALPGLIFVEWNIEEDSPGSAAMWDSHVRVGGTLGTKLQVAECPPVMEIKSACIAASMLMHVTSSSNGYFENVWAWVADHDIDDAENKQVTIAVARGILIESDGPTWFYGTSSEHALLYQYNFYNTTDSLAAMIQTESPYFQYTAATASPGPFNSTIGQFGNDPIFPDATCTGTDLLCNFSWALMVKDSTDVTIAGAGLYSWFDNLDQGQACVGAQNCQQRLVEIGSGNSAFSIFNLITIGAVEMISDVENSVTILAEDNTQAIAHPFWSALGAFINHSETQLLVCAGDDNSEECLVEPICDKSLEFSSLDTLQAATGTFPEVCTDAYAIGALSSMLGASVANFTTINDGYDDVWGYYVKYVKQMIPSALYEFMRGPSANNPSGGPGNKFFTCVQHQHGEVSASVQCPMDSGLLSIAEYTVYYTIHNSTGFYAELQELYGILPEWVVLGDEDFGEPCVDAPRCITIDQRKRGFPIPAPDEKIIVPNPKEVMTAAQPRIANLTNALFSAEIDLNLGSWLGPAVDLVEVLSMPVFMIMQAIDSMLQAKDIGEEMREEERRNFILMIISIIFSFLPFVGEALGIIGGIAAGIGRIAVLVSTGVDIGLGIEQIVHDKASAPMAILGMLGGGLTRSEFNIGKLASTRRGFLPTDIKSMGTVFKSRDDQLQTIIGACKRS